MIPPLEESWRILLDELARERKWPTSSDVKRLSACVGALSAAYNDGSGAPAARARSQDALAARLLFSFPRDIQKGSAAVRELIESGLLRLPEVGSLRVLDLGAGMGAMSLGIARALAVRGALGNFEATLVDEDAAVLDVAAQIFKRRMVVGTIRTVARCVPASVATPPLVRNAYDVVVLGQLLSELHRDRPEEERIARHAELIRALARCIRPDGSIVVVEPALRARTRHLHAVRDALLGTEPSPEVADAPPLTLFAPCLHQRACPMLSNPGDWCHEDLPINLPPWLVDVARGAGLRWEGLTYSYLILRRDGATLSKAHAGPDGVRLRVVSDPIVTKGKSEIFLCGESGILSRPTRLDRAKSEGNAIWSKLSRGDLVTIRPFAEQGPQRIEKTTQVERWG